MSRRSHVTVLERKAIHAVLHFKTVMPVDCMWCRKIFDYKDGLGMVGNSSSVCPTCESKGLSFFR